MKTLTIQLPETTELSDFEARMILASKLYEMGRLSSGQAAELAGLSKRAFIEMLGKFGVSVFGYTADELAQDLKNL
jgi:predicted HTH domain antitoxin